MGDWRLVLVPNGQVLYNVLTSIREVAAAENTEMHKLIVQNPLAKSMIPKECDELVSRETQKCVYEEPVATQIGRLATIHLFGLREPSVSSRRMFDLRKLSRPRLQRKRTMRVGANAIKRKGLS